MKSLKTAGNLLVFAVIAIVILFPLYWLLVTSLKPSDEIFADPPTLFPKTFSLEHYRNVFRTSEIPTYFYNSVLITAVTVIAVLAIASLAAYSMTRYKFKGKLAYFVVILFAQVMPITTLIVPLYVMWGKLDMLNTFTSLIMTYCAVLLPMAIWLLTGYFKGIPKDIDEAATIDGCSSFGILIRMVLPLARSGLVAVGLTVCITVWQEIMVSMTFVNTDSMRTLPAGINSFITKSGIQWGPLNASGIVTTLPVLLIFIIFQRALVKGLTAGATKG
ncbi:carbohydrate ABC transporter permease [Paenibacillus rhizovicinus]|uniref:Carbohydrate ABC transporter permease n=1 Tax=Paenibacillus rhizovicinus TaxID=2704463 RepID=A0A6C0NYW2_9BACL|nr:carbohydrate ABC transporter permease [Paenibacillus rhizovicinus]QHW31389.1 carbohydrate ABC transporter permease [Paenibacillus rhizovicinus]